MRHAAMLFATLAAALVVASPALAATPDADAVKAELRALYAAYNDAGTRRDRAALEALFADGYVWIQANGRIVERSRHIENILGNAAEFRVGTPAFDGLVVLGDVAISRTPTPSGINSTVHAKRDGRWQFVQAQGTRKPPEHKAVAVDASVFDAYVGAYEFAPNGIGKVTREGDTLMWQGGRRAKVKLVPLSKTSFAVAESDISIVFADDGFGSVTHLDLTQGACTTTRAPRMR